MLEDSENAAVARRHILQVCLQKVDSSFNLVCDFAARQNPRPSCRQLNRKWHSLHQLTDAHDVRHVFLVKGYRIHLLRAFNEQIHGAELTVSHAR